MAVGVPRMAGSWNNLWRQLRRLTGAGLLAGALGWLSAADQPPNGEAAKEIPPLQDKTKAQELHPTLVNGSLETPNADKTGPLGWDRPDGLTTFWIDTVVDGKPTKVWKIDTHVLETEFLARRKAVQDALDNQKPVPPAPAKTEPKPAEQYNCVGGTYGVQIFSEPVKVKSGVAYKLKVRIKGPESGKDATGNYFFFPRIFVKGYVTIKDRERVAYKAYLACRLDKADTWLEFERDIHPTDKVKKVDYLRVMLYCYWPLGTYHIDNIELIEIPPPAGQPGGVQPEQPTTPPAADPVQKP